MSRRNFTDKVKEERWLFAEKRCEGTLPDGNRCNADIAFKPWDCDHNIPDRAGGKPTFENARALCKACHKAKYPLDRKIIDKVKRNGFKHAGIKPIMPDKPIRGPQMPTTARAAARAARAGDRLPMLPPRNLFVSIPTVAREPRKES